MTAKKLQNLGKKLFFLGFLGTALAGLLIYLGRQPGYVDIHGVFIANPYSQISSYFFIGYWIFFILLLFGCWMVLKGKRQRLRIWLVFILVPYINLFVLKKVFDLPDLSSAEDQGINL